MEYARFIVLVGDSSRNPARFDSWEEAYTYAQNSAKGSDLAMSIYERQGVMTRDPITTTWTADPVTPGVSDDEAGATVDKAVERDELYKLDRGHEPDTEASRARSALRDRDS